MAAADPADREAVQGQADALIELGRFPEAIRLLEPTAPFKPDMRGMWARSLVLAYLGAGRDANAIELLRTHNAATEVDAHLSQLRPQLQAIRSRK